MVRPMYRPNVAEQPPAPRPNTTPIDGCPALGAQTTRRNVLTLAAGMAVTGIAAGSPIGLKTAEAAGAGAVGGPAGAPAADQPTAWFREAHARIVGDRSVARERIKLELPDRAENGNMVPFTVSVESPMTVEDHVRTITILSPLNPHAVIATFELTPVSGIAKVAGRLRLARSQEVIVLAETSTGRLFGGSRKVEVVVGGCGTG